MSAADERLAVLVSSCDAYSDAWHPFFTLLFRYWSDCPYPIYLITESKRYDDQRVQTIAVNDASWGVRLAKALDTVPQLYVLYVQEDYFLKERVDTARVRELFEILVSDRVGSVRLYPDPAPQVPYREYRGVGEVVRGTPYRMSTQATMWDKEVLRKVMKKDPWATEHEGSKVSDTLPEPFLSVYRKSRWGSVSPVFEYVCTGISKRLWTWEAVHLFRREHVDVDLTKRSIEKYSTYLRRSLRRLPFIGEAFRHLYRVEYKLKTMLRPRQV